MKKEKVLVSLDPLIHKRARKQADADGRTLPNLMAFLLAEYLREAEPRG